MSDLEDIFGGFSWYVIVTETQLRTLYPKVAAEFDTVRQQALKHLGWLKSFAGSTSNPYGVPAFADAMRWMDELATFVEDVVAAARLLPLYPSLPDWMQAWNVDQWSDKQRANAVALSAIGADVRQLQQAKPGLQPTPTSSSGDEGGGVAALGGNALTMLGVGLLGWGAYKRDSGTITSGAMLVGMSLLIGAFAGPSAAEKLIAKATK
jgi:hypothetical protein